jgi:hypothetical protein
MQPAHNLCAADEHEGSLLVACGSAEFPADLLCHDYAALRRARSTNLGTLRPNVFPALVTDCEPLGRRSDASARLGRRRQRVRRARGGVDLAATAVSSGGGGSSGPQLSVGVRRGVGHPKNLKVEYSLDFRYSTHLLASDACDVSLDRVDIHRTTLSSQ